MTETVTQLLVAALKQGLAEPGEQRLFRSGKLAGLFASRVGASGEAAAQALHDGLLEVVRTEVKGKTSIEWVRPTPRAVEFLHEHQSPRQALQDLLAVLQSTQTGMPRWLSEVQAGFQAQLRQIAEDWQRWQHRLDTLAGQVEQALRRLEADGSDNGSSTVPWRQQAIRYLERRDQGQGTAKCPLPELFAALRTQWPDLSVTQFHDGLRRLRDQRAVRLLPFDRPLTELAEPEFALPDGLETLFYVCR